MELMFAERLRKYRRERDLTQEELAQEIGISPPVRFQMGERSFL